MMAAVVCVWCGAHRVEGCWIERGDVHCEHEAISEAAQP